MHDGFVGRCWEPPFEERRFPNSPSRPIYVFCGFRNFPWPQPGADKSDKSDTSDRLDQSEKATAELVKAHQALDRAGGDLAYRPAAFLTDRARVEFLIRPLRRTHHRPPGGRNEGEAEKEGQWLIKFNSMLR